jgi:hypothetical protein
VLAVVYRAADTAVEGGRRWRGLDLHGKSEIDGIAPPLCRKSQSPVADDPERRLTLRQADQARGDFAAILDAAFLREQLARLPTRVAEPRPVGAFAGLPESWVSKRPRGA